MIQELLGGAGFIGGERRISFGGTILEGTTSTLPLPSTTTTTATITTTTTAAAVASAAATTTATTAAAAATTSATNSNTSSTPENQNLRCPRCDSSNTKFCYYNNYNLTQPRHFCKTCRRYWTKGGALRNVPIGGGCRKNKNSTMSAIGKSSSAAKMKTVAYEFGRSGFGNEFDHEFSSTPIMWTSPQNSQLLALLRTTQNPNINPVPFSNSGRVKEEPVLVGTHVIKAEPVVANGALNTGTMVLDPLNQVPSLGLSSPLWKNNQHQAQPYQQNGFLVGHEVQNSGVQELCHRLKSSTNYYADHSTSTLALSNAGSSASSSTSIILQSAPVAGGELGFWNPVFSWSDHLPTSNGAYP